MNVLLVAFGSACGGAARYLMGLIVPAISTFPLATLMINVIGSFLIGLISGLLVRFTSGAAVEALRLVLVVGFCGGFTTFSTFSSETLRLIESAQYLFAAFYVFASVSAGLIAVGIGFRI